MKLNTLGATLAAVGTAVGLLAALPQAQAQAATAPAPAPGQDIVLSYQIDLNGEYAPITHIITFNTYVDRGTGSWFAASIPAQVQSALIVDPFLKNTDNAPLNALMLGLVQDLPNDAPGQEHIVMMVNNTAAQASEGIAWGTLFRNTLEEQLIADMHLLTSGLPLADIQTELGRIYDFALGDAVYGIPFPTTNTPLSTWFDLALPGIDQNIATSDFSVMAFSNGQRLGTGVASVAYLAPVPEPRAAALWLSGLLALGLLSRARTRA